MPLSEHEQRMLDQLEQQLEMEDPQFVNTMQSVGRGWTLARVLGGSVIVLAGLGVLLGAVASNLLWLGIVGFALMLAGAWFAFMSKPTKASKGISFGAKKATQPGTRSMSAKFEERWERRQRGE